MLTRGVGELVHIRIFVPAESSHAPELRRADASQHFANDRRLADPLEHARQEATRQNHGGQRQKQSRQRSGRRRRSNFSSGLGDGVRRWRLAGRDGEAFPKRANGKEANDAASRQQTIEQ